MDPGLWELLSIYLPNPDIWDADLEAAATAVGRTVLEYIRDRRHGGMNLRNGRGKTKTREESKGRP
jgi:hypothetical protein